MQSGSPFLALLSGLAEIAAVLAAVFAVFLLIREWTDRQNVRLQQVLLGLLFAGSVVYCMAFPAELAPSVFRGVIVDPSAALLALSGLVGGPVVAATSLLVTVAVRGWLGGAGMLAGITGSVLASMLGLGLWWASGRDRTGPPTWRPLLAAAAGAAAIGLLVFLLVPPFQAGLGLMREAGPAIALVQFASVLLLGGLLRAEGGLHRYRTLAEAAPAAVCVTDEATGRFLFANRRAHQLLEVPEGGLRGKTMPSFYVEPAQREALVREIRRTGGVEDRTIEVVTAAGRNVVLAVTVRPGHWDGRRALIWAAVDVSGIRSMHRELNRQDALNSTILETLSDGLVVMDPDGAVRVFNPMAERIFGWDADEILGRNVSLLLADRRRDDVEDGTPLDRLLAKGRRVAGGTRHEIGGRRRDGSTFPLEITVAEIATGENGGERYLLGIVRDVTDRRRSIDALIEARTAAEVAHRTQRDFLAHMSHELRTPLNSILGFSQMIQLGAVGPVPDKYRDYAASIHLAGDHLLRLINDVLDLSKVEQGYLSLHEDRVRPEDLLDAVARLFKPKAEERNLLLEGHPPADPFDILGDFVRLRQILFNLVSNGIKFSPAGGRVTVGVGRDDGGDVLITVADSGIGMTAEEAVVALKPFGQVRSEVTRSHEGTGLGLSISKSLAERHGGSLEIESTPQQGTTVTVRLPAARALPRDAGAPS